MFETIAALVLAAGILSTPAATPAAPAECTAALTPETPWIVAVHVDETDADGCLQSVGLEGALATVQADDSALPVVIVQGNWSDKRVTISFTDGGFAPNIIEVSGWYGSDRTEYHAITTCLSEDTFRSDGKAKNDTCAVTEHENGDLWLTFDLPEAHDSVTEITLFLQVQWYEPLNGASTSPHHVIQWAMTLRLVDQ